MTTHCKTPSQNGKSTMRAAIIGIIAAYAVLFSALLVSHPDTVAVLSDIKPFLVIGGVGLALSIGPLLLPNLQAKLPITGHGLGKACAQQALAPQRVFGLMAMGMLLGSLLHQLIKLIAA